MTAVAMTGSLLSRFLAGDVFGIAAFHDDAEETEQLMVSAAELSEMLRELPCCPIRLRGVAWFTKIVWTILNTRLPALKR